MKYSIIVYFILLALPGNTQIVKTLPVKGLNGPNGFAIDKNGQLYIANEPGGQVVKVINDSTTEVVLTSDSPAGLTFDNAGNLYISNFHSGIILRKTSLSIDTITKGLDKPGDIKWHNQGDLYVSEYEKGNIKKIDNTGQVILVASGFRHPFGLVFDNEGNLYIASNDTGEIFKLDPKGTVSVFAQIPGALSYLAFSKKTKRVYATCFTCHNIYVISMVGKVMLVSGDGIAGDKDGKLNEAQFRGPNSIEISSDGSLYISEFSVNRIRKITNLEN